MCHAHSGHRASGFSVGTPLRIIVARQNCPAFPENKNARSLNGQLSSGSAIMRNGGRIGGGSEGEALGLPKYRIK